MCLGVGVPLTVIGEVQTSVGKSEKLGFSKTLEASVGHDSTKSEKLSGTTTEYDLNGTFAVYERCIQFSHETAGVTMDLSEVSNTIPGMDNRLFIHLKQTEKLLAFKFPLSAPSTLVDAVLNRAMKDRSEFKPEVSS
jgi:hypothetical protein